jgi:orotate phosphoribosyltransferase-like protein
LYNKEWYEWKIKGMTKEKIAQELEIDYNTAIV